VFGGRRARHTDGGAVRAANGGAGGGGGGQVDGQVPGDPNRGVAEGCGCRRRLWRRIRQGPGAASGRRTGRPGRSLVLCRRGHAVDGRPHGSSSAQHCPRPVGVLPHRVQRV